MRTYIQEVSSRLPRVAPEYEYRLYAKGQNLGFVEQVVVPMAMWRDRVDLAHYMSLYVPVFAGGRFVFTIHDVIHLRYKEYFKSYIEPYYMTVVKRACRKAARIITSDRRTIDDLVYFFGADPQRIRVVPLAPREKFFSPAAPFRAERPYLLYVGNHREHKDIPTLVKAWEQLAPHYEIDLYVTGPDDLQGLLQRASTSRRRAIALGNPTDDQLASYYAGAFALVHPALLEGFGLPFVEAMAQGCPLIATSSSIPDPIAAVALTFEPRNAEGARAQIERLLDDQALRTDLVERGRTVVATLNWDRTARETADVYREILEEHG